MNIPITIGFPQLLFLLIGILGLLLIISSLTGRRRRSSESYEIQKEKEGFSTYPGRHRRFRWGRGIGGTLLLAVALSLFLALLALEADLQTYLGLTREIQVAHIRATPIANVAHEMSVELILYDEHGHQTSDNTYLVHGDEWMVQGDILKFSPWLNVIGLHSGYKLTRLEGRYDDIKLENTAPRTALELNGGDDNFFTTAYTQKSWFSPFVDAAYGNAVFQVTGTFDVVATQDALIARPAK
jgi:hypothetical protein